MRRSLGPLPAAAPSFALPAGATDCHVHFFVDGPEESYVAERDYTPAPAGAAALRAVYDTFGIRRFVVIQPSVHGTDNSVQLDQAEAVGLPFRAVAVAGPETPDRAMEALHARGVRGIRYILAHPGGLDLSGLERSADQARALGWHLEFLLKPAQLLELEPRLARLSCPFSCDHVAFMDPAHGLAQPAFLALRRLLDAGSAWVKLSGAYRMTGRADEYDATIPFGRALAGTYGERLVWGSDWPHVGQFTAMPDTTRLLNLLAAWVPEDALRRRILVENAEAFYGFETEAPPP